MIMIGDVFVCWLGCGGSRRMLAWKIVARWSSAAVSLLVMLLYGVLGCGLRNAWCSV